MSAKKILSLNKIVHPFHPFQQLFSYYKQDGWRQWSWLSRKVEMIPVLAVGRTRAVGFKFDKQDLDGTRRARAECFIQCSRVQIFLVIHAQSTSDPVSCSVGVHQQQGVFPVPLSNPLSPQLFNAVQLSCCCLSFWQLRQQQYNISEPLSMSAWRLAIKYCKG